MKEHQKTIEEFDILLDAELAKSSSDKSEKAIPQDSPLYLEYEQHKLMVSAIRSAGRKDLLRAIKGWDNEMAALTKARTMAIRSVWYYAAASVAVLLTFSWLWIGYSDSDNLVAQHYEPYSYVSETTRGDLGDAKDSEIEKAYLQGEYQKVIDKVTSIDVASRTLKIDFLYANACQATGSVKQAIPVFERIAAIESPYTVASQWYLALCHLSEKDADKAIPPPKDVQSARSS